MASARFCRRPGAFLRLFELQSQVPILSRNIRTRPNRPNESPTTTPPSTETPPASDNGSAAQQTGSQPPPQRPNMSDMLAQTPDEKNNLLAPVHIPEDPNAVLKSDHPATNLLTQSGIVVQRQIEMMNVFLGFEQANRYVIMDPHGNHIGYIAEHDGGIAKTMGRQWFRTHRAFTTHVFDRHQQEVLRFHRPFSWINTRIRVYDPWEASKSTPISSSTDVSTNVKDSTIDGMHTISQMPLSAMRIIGEAQSEWAPLRRKYNLFLAHELENSQQTGTEPVPSDLSDKQRQQVSSQANFAQFAYIDEPFLSWDFSLKGADNKLIGSVNRNWGGLGREFFTDTGMYVLRMDSAGLDEEAEKRHIVSQTHKEDRAYAEALGATRDKGGMTLDERAVMLATAVTVDFDYFSRHSHGGGLLPMPLMMGGGGGAAEGGAAAGAAGAAGAGAEAGAIGETVGGGAIGAAGRAAGTAGAGEGAIAGAGTMAGYEAMQRGMGRDSQGGDAPPPDQSPSGPTDPQSPQYGSQYDPQSPQYGNSPESQSSGGQEGGDLWGSGDSDPWQGGSETGGGGEGGGSGEGGGIISQLWDAFFGD